jgi:murein DD-endopeptidase MepM/ murein hydrolase activator NlpD
MNQPYFIVVLAHSLHGRIRRFHIDHKVVYAVLALALIGSFTVFGLVSSYLRMAWKVANYNSLRQEADFLRARYQKLLSESNQTTNQLARLQIFASEVAVAYGIRKQGEIQPLLSDASTARLVPTLSESFAEYDLLKSAKISTFSRSYSRRWLLNNKPSLWPVIGRLLSHFGHRDDPFSGRDAFHPGTDISAVIGTPVRATADGIVVAAEWSSGYGKLIVLDHGQGLRTYYAHLSRYDVVAGQEVRLGQVIGGSGATGRVTSPHLHYEVRIGGNPVNPYPYLAKSALGPVARTREFGF